MKNITQFIRVLIADDHKLFREGLRRLLESEQGVEIAGEAENGRMAVQMAADLSPDVIFMDIGMPDLNGIDATRHLMANGKGPKVIALSCHPDSRSVDEMLRAGAMAYVLKEEAYEELVAALRAVMVNEVYLCPRMARAIVQGMQQGRAPDNVRPNGELSLREREILQLIAEGKATKQVAAMLKLSVKTVETHRRNIMQKLELDNIADLTKYAIREGITSVDIRNRQPLSGAE